MIDSPTFILLFFSGAVIYNQINVKKFRLFLLLIFSYYFYFNIVKFNIIFLLIDTFVIYIFSNLISKTISKRAKNNIFILVVVLLILPLITFKYISEFINLSENFLKFFDSNNIYISITAPIGLSFFTFAAIGYVADVYNDNIIAEKRLSRLAIFLSFFPLITAGPIEKGERFFPQLDSHKTVNFEIFYKGFFYTLFGLFYKLFISYNLSTVMYPLILDNQKFEPLEKLVGTFYYTFYLYTDFFGYSLIAMGCAKMLGFSVISNFNSPLISTTVPEFWQNWHISLSSWIRDYIFFPLSMSWRNLGKAGLYLAILSSFVIIGVWHGTGWNYLIFGFLHGILVVISHQTLYFRNYILKSIGFSDKIISFLRSINTFVVVSLIFVFFYSKNLNMALEHLRSILNYQLIENFLQLLDGDLQLKIINNNEFIIPLIILIVFIDFAIRKKLDFFLFPKLIQYCCAIIMTLSIIYIWLSKAVPPPFVYYKF